MNYEDYVIDYTEENKPQKPPMSAKTKKKLIYLGCAALGVLVALLGVYLVGLIFSGAPTPEKAVAEYVKAHNLYDIDGMIEYSSQYNKIQLYEKRETNNRLLKAYLKKAYSGATPRYTEDEIGFALISVIEYEPETETFKTQMERYDKVTKGGSEEIEKTAVVKMKVVTGDITTEQEYLTVKIGSRWYYAGNTTLFK